MATLASPAATMKLVGGDPCLDFVNTVGGRTPGLGGAQARVRADKLVCYSDLAAWSVHAGLLGQGQGRGLLRLAAARPREALAAFGRALAFREALYRALRALMLGRGPAPADLAALNLELAACRSREVLAAGREGLRWEWRNAAERLESPLWPVARAAAALLTSPELARLRQCGGDECGWLFLDRTRNHSRQWCTMEDCGNVSKVRRFRQRHAGLRRPGR
jgi:predicted RNA-binding Zn ribbon-like protein